MSAKCMNGVKCNKQAYKTNMGYFCEEHKKDLDIIRKKAIEFIKENPKEYEEMFSKALQKEIDTQIGKIKNQKN